MRRSAFLLATLAIAPVAAQQRPTFRASADAVLIDVSVTDGRGSVANLKPADFDVKDNGVSQTVTDLDYGHLPIDVRMVFDISGSLSDADLARQSRAMTQFQAALKPGDRCELLSFNRRATSLAPLGPPPIDSTLKRSGPDGTAFFDAVGLAMITTPRAGRRQLTIVLSDGNDTSSFFDEPALMRAAAKTDAVVYAVAPATALDAGASISTTNRSPGVTTSIVSAGAMTSDSGGRLLGLLATATGGRVIRLDRSGDIGAAFLKAVDDFRQSYVLHYTPDGVDAPGWHAVTVAVRGNKKYVIRAKQGYEGGR